jgi:ABC-type nitrate/sulfonate/bicarbonate transport system, permease component
MYSLEHKNYLKYIKRKNFSIKICQILIIVSFIIIWQLLASLKIINTFITSSPKDIINTIVSLYKQNNLFIHIFTTFYETIISFILGSLIGIIIASLFWWNEYLAKTLAPYLTILNSLPKVALGPIIIIWVGANTNSIILMALMVSVIITIINVYEGFKNTDKLKIDLFKSLKASKDQIFYHVVFKSNIRVIISSCKICVSMSLIGVLMGELLVSKQGLGYLIMYGSQVFNLNLVMSGIMLLCLLASIMYYSVSYIEKLIIKTN